ncbi:hypothetical protein YPPY95_2112, partial [Yersinia pestis PY-95]
MNNKKPADNGGGGG